MQGVLYGKPSTNAPGVYWILKIWGEVFIGRRRLKKGGVYKILSGEIIL